jgi:hypothetical protein
MRLSANQLRKIINEEAKNILRESASDPQIAALMTQFVADVRAVDPAINFGELEDALRKAFRRPAKVDPAARSAAAKKGAATRAAGKASYDAYSKASQAGRQKVLSALEDMGISKEEYADAEYRVFGGGSMTATGLDVIEDLLGSRAAASQFLKDAGVKPGEF